MKIMFGEIFNEIVLGFYLYYFIILVINNFVIKTFYNFTIEQFSGRGSHKAK